MEHVAETTGKEFWWCPKCGRPETAKKLLKREKPNILLGIEWEYE